MKISEMVNDKRLNIGLPSNYIITLIVYLLALIAAELLTTYVNKIWGLSLHTIILFALLVNASMVESPDFANLLRSLMPIPIIRVVGLSIPMMQIQPLYWFPIVAIPLFAASIILMRNQGLSLKDVGMTLGGNIKLQALIAATGFFFRDYRVFHPQASTPYRTVHPGPSSWGLLYTLDIHWTG
nr:hypothetical protein [Methanobacterium formicicum]